jgi:hypothetical protein
LQRLGVGEVVLPHTRSSVLRIATKETFACVGGKGTGDLLGDVRWREGDDEIGEVGRLVRECLERRNKPRFSRGRQPHEDVIDHLPCKLPVRLLFLAVQ